MEYFEIMPKPRENPGKPPSARLVADQRAFEKVQRGRPCRHQRGVGRDEQADRKK